MLILLPLFLWSTIPSVLHSDNRRGATHRAKQRHEYTFQAISNHQWRPDDVSIVAHRGCIARFPENTLAAIAACSEEGAHVVEIDLERTLDGHLILMHDNTIERTTNRRQWLGTSAVANYTLEQLQSSFWSVQNEYTGVVLPFRIPTFAEALQTAKRCGLHLYIDIKKRYHIEQLVVEEIHKADAFDFVLLQSFKECQPTSENAAKIQHVQWLLDDQETLDTSSVTFQARVDWRTKPHALCSFRTATHIGPFVNVLWSGGDYFLRDPDQLRQNSPLQRLFDAVENRQQQQSPFTFTHPPCIYTSNFEDACLGAHLYQPVVQSHVCTVPCNGLTGNSPGGSTGQSSNGAHVRVSAGIRTRIL
jgi:glycerophosphoryl diester phosphodiesterase